MSNDRRVAVIGLGYVGPAARPGVRRGRARGRSASTPASAGSTSCATGRSPIDDVDDARLQRQLDAGFRIVAPADAGLDEADAIFVCVPTPITQAKDPDLGPGPSARPRSSAGTSGPASSSSSSRRPSRARRRARSASELEGSGLRPARDFDLAFAPERVNPGDPASAIEERAAARRRDDARRDEARRDAPPPHQRPRRRAVLARRRGAREAPRERLPEREHRARQPARPALRADGRRRLGGHRRRGDEAVRVHAVPPGPGVGGHCIPVDPYYLSWRAREFDFVDRFVELAGDINLAMPRHVVDLVAEALNDRGQAIRGAQVGDPRRRLQAERPRPAELARGRRDGAGSASAAPS